MILFRGKKELRNRCSLLEEKVKKLEMELATERQSKADPLTSDSMQVFDLIPQRIFWKDKNLIYRGCNISFANDAGFYYADDVIGKSDYDLHWENSAESFRKDDLEVLATGKPKIGFEEKQERTDGSTGWLRTSKLPLFDDKKNIIGVLGTYEDITSEKNNALLVAQQTEEIQAQNEEMIALNDHLRENYKELSELNTKLEQDRLLVAEQKDYLETTLRSIGDAVITTDRSGKIMHVNRMAESLTGYGKSLALGKYPDGILTLINPKTKLKISDPTAEVLTNKQPVNLSDHTQLVTEAGKKFHVAYTASPIISANSNCLGVIIVFRDISVKYEMEQRLRESEERLKLKLDYLLSPEKELKNIKLTDIIDIEELQKIQDTFARTNKVASIITDVNGKPLTNESNFSNVCNLIRKTEKGKLQCYNSDRILGEKAMKFRKAVKEDCHSCGFIDAAAPIIVGGKHIANWMIGQSNTGKATTSSLSNYADEIGIEGDTLVKAYENMPMMEATQFDAIVDLLEVMAGEISTLGYNNLKLAKNIEELKKSKSQIENAEKRFKAFLEATPDTIAIFNHNWTLLESFSSVSDSLSDSFLHQTGKTIDEILSNTITSLFKETLDSLVPGDFKSINFQLEQKDKSWYKTLLGTIEIRGENQIMTVSRNITQEKLYLDKLKEHEFQRQAILNNLPHLAWLKDKEGKFLYVNEIFAKSVNSRPEELKGKTDQAVFDEAHAAKYMKDDKYVMENKIPLFTEEYLLIDNVASIVETFKSPTFNPHGEVTGTTGIALDITKRKRDEEELKKTRNQLQQILNNTNAVIMMISESLEIDWISPSCKKLLGYEVSELSYNSLNFIVHKEDKNHIQNYISEVIAGKQQARTTELRIRNAAGEYLWFASSGSFYQDPDTTKSLYLGVFTDISIRKEMLSELKRSEDLYRQLMETSPDAISVFDLEGNLVLASPETYHLFRAKSKDLQDINIFQHVSPSDLLRAKANVRKLLEGKELNNPYSQYVFVRLDGSTFVGEIRSSVVNDEKGKPLNIISVIRNVTRQKITEEALIMAREKAEAADRLKSAFLANMSHEIRTPMNGIIGFSNLLDNPGVTPEQRQEYVRIINVNGKALLNLINDIIDLSKIEAGQMNLLVEKINIHTLMRELHTMYLKILDESNNKAVDLILNLDVEDIVMATDENRLRQIMMNLLNNAIKFTEEGSIEFGCHRLDNDEVEFFVADTGIGIEPEKSRIIFDRFRQIDETNSRKYGGTGLGLAICKQLTRLLGGTMWVESKVGDGSKFIFTISELQEDPGVSITKTEIKTDKKNTSSNSKKTILIAEDEHINFLFLKEVLAPFNFNIHHANNGRELIELYKNKNVAADLILMDIKMPEMDGYEATRKIREQNTEIPVFAVTAFAMSEEKKNGLAAGCNEYISKPIDTDMLYRLIKQYLDIK